MINADGTGRSQLALDLGGGAVWSPDGQKIAFSAVEGTNAEIFVMNADGTGRLKLTNDPGEDLSPSWSPDGSQLAFLSNRAGSDQVDYDAYVISADGSNLQALTSQQRVVSRPTWGPDGAQLAFEGIVGVASDILSIRLDGTGLTKPHQYRHNR